jgi:LCP family protein required for cell wall assembly
MDIIKPLSQYNFESAPIKKPWFKKPLFYIFFLVIILVVYFAYQLGSAYTKISVENKPWWQAAFNVFDINNTSPVPTVDPNPMPQPDPNRLNVLILGIRGDDQVSIEQEGGLLTDTLMVLSVDKVTKKAAIVSIPRDLYLNMSAQAADGKAVKLDGKINEVYERGIEHGGGLTLAKQILSRITGIYINNAVLFDFNAFKQVVDTLGGVDVYLAKPFEEDKQWGYPFSLPAGNNHLSGDQALYYVRSRFSSSDFDRSRRQQDVIQAIKKKALSLGLLTNPLKINSLLNDLKGNIRTDFQIWDLKNIIDLGDSLTQKNAANKSYIISIDNLVSEAHGPKGEYILVPKEPDFKGFKDLFKNILVTP